MKKSRIAAAAVLTLAGVGGGLWMYRRAEASEPPAYRFATVTRGDLSSSVSATGALSAVTTVQVGTQVSGQIAQIYVDFNDQVKKGQLLARIDPTLQEQTVRDAQASLERTQAELQQSQREYDRNKQLHDSKVLTDVEFQTSEYNLTIARAGVKSAQVALDRARQNLAYTRIYAPIDGVVVERNVDVGQTVAASLSAPQLFLIANDLGRMQILASVDESDIGLIKEGQPVRFSVQTYPNETFTGAVKQVRLQSTTQENVVNYTVVVEVENRSGKLLPGMTATADFQTGSATDVLMVPNAALRIRVTPEMLAEAGVQNSAAAGARRQADSASAPDVRRDAPAGATAATAAAPTTGARASGTRGTRAADAAMLWTVDASGTLRAIRVRTGLTDGQNTQVTGQGLEEGMQVITALAQSTTASGATSASPFQPQAQGGPRPPGGF